MIMTYLLAAIVAAVIVYRQIWKWTHRRMLELADVIPGPPALPIIGNALFFVKRPRETLQKVEYLHKIYGQYIKFWLGPDLNICVNNPADVRALLTNNKVNHKGPVYDLLIPIVGPGILTGGSTWRNHRKIVTPTYNKKSVQKFMPIFNAEAEELARVLTTKNLDQQFDVYKDVVTYTTLCVNQTLMGLTRKESKNIYRLEEIVEKTRGMYDFLFTKMINWWLHIPLIFWLVGGSRKQNYYIKLIDDFVSDIIKKKRIALNNTNPDEVKMGIVDRYILSGELTEYEIKCETMTLFTTSQEASAKIASGVLMFLAHLPDWQVLIKFLPKPKKDKVYNEIIEVVGEDGAVTPEELKRLVYLDMVYKEALRLLSIAAMIQRTVEEEVTINEGKITIPAGTSLVIPVHHLHRNPKHWENPDKVMPERFLPENVMKRDPNTFVPFSWGPMDCLGRVYATALIKTIVVWVLRYNHLEPAVSLDDLKLDVAISVSVAGGYNIKVKPRNYL